MAALAPLQELPNGHNTGTPPCAKQGGVKNLHSPWSAPRDRKKRTKQEPSALTIIDEVQYSSPPKRHNGAARERGGGSQGIL